jgi:hypothetical protein
VSIDIELILRRVVDDVFGDDVVVEYSTERNDPRFHRARVTSVDGKATDVGLRAGYWWFEAQIFELNVSTFLVDEDDDEADKEALLRQLAIVLRAYVQGEGRVEYRPTPIRRRQRPHYIVEIDGEEWRLGQESGVSHYPQMRWPG